MIAGDQPRGAGADTVALDRLDRRGFERRMMAQPEIIVAGERQQFPAAALDPEVVEAAGRNERAAQMRRFQGRELLPGEIVEGGHVCRILAARWIGNTGTTRACPMSGCP